MWVESGGWVCEHPRVIMDARPFVTSHFARGPEYRSHVRTLQTARQKTFSLLTKKPPDPRYTLRRSDTIGMPNSNLAAVMEAGGNFLQFRVKRTCCHNSDGVRDVELNRSHAFIQLLLERRRNLRPSGRGGMLKSVRAVCWQGSSAA